MKDLSVYVLRHALSQLPCAEQHHGEMNGSPYFVQVPTQLQAVRNKEPWNDERVDGQEIRLTFVAEQSVQNDRGRRWYDWVLVSTENITMKW